MQEHPNVLIFCVDQMRADHMGCAGNKSIRTPSLDRLAEDGVIFNRSYCNNPVCMPARATMFTGLLPRDHGVRMNGQSLRKDIPTMPGILRDSGYSTHACGKLHLTPWVPDVSPPDVYSYPECMKYWNEGLLSEFPVPYYGFETVDFVGGHTCYAYGPYVEWLEKQGGNRGMLTESSALQPPSGAPQCYKMSLPEELHYNRFIADSAIRKIRRSQGNRENPFFIWCSFPDPHLPVAPPAPYCDMYDPGAMPPPKSGKGEIDRLPSVYKQVLDGSFRPNGTLNTGVEDSHWQEMIALTYGMVTHVDTEIGRVVKALDDTGLSSDTLVVFTSDHGDMMGDHGLLWKAFYTFAGCIRTPLIVKVPGITSGHRSEDLVSQLDLLPSILDICNIRDPADSWVEKKTPFSRGAMRPLLSRPGRSWRNSWAESQLPSVRLS